MTEEAVTTQLFLFLQLFLYLFIYFFNFLWRGRSGGLRAAKVESDFVILSNVYHSGIVIWLGLPNSAWLCVCSFIWAQDWIRFGRLGYKKEKDKKKGLPWTKEDSPFHFWLSHCAPMNTLLMDCIIFELFWPEDQVMYYAVRLMGQGGLQPKASAFKVTKGTLFQPG